jgi:hypothetical protein
VVVYFLLSNNGWTLNPEDVAISHLQGFGFFLENIKVYAALCPKSSFEYNFGSAISKKRKYETGCLEKMNFL